MRDILKAAFVLLLPAQLAWAQEPAAAPSPAEAPEASQAEPAAAPAAPAAPAAAEPATPPPAEAPTAPPAQVAPAPPPAEDPAAVQAAPAAQPAVAVPVPVAVTETTTVIVDEPVPPAEDMAEEGDDYGFAYSMFADAYYNFDWNLPRQMDANGTQPHRAYVRTNGFALSFLGFEASYTQKYYGVTASLRMGPSAGPLIGQQDGALGLEFVKQAFVTLTPTDSLTIDLGQFDTIYGAEVADSWSNINYTRGALYFLMQPFWHTGLRVGYAASDEVALNFLVVNGVNSAFDSDRAVDLGAQVAFTPNDTFSAYLGYYGAQAKPDGQPWSHFFDLVLNANFQPVTLVFNADLGVKDYEDLDDYSIYYGLSLAGRLALNQAWALGLRGEYLSEKLSDNADPADALTVFPDHHLATGTLTLEYIPVGMENLIFRLDNRLEYSDVQQFVDKDGPTDTYVSSVLGVVVKTD